jgi:hypothetical protein
LRVNRCPGLHVQTVALNSIERIMNHGEFDVLVAIENTRKDMMVIPDQYTRVRH